MPNQNQINALLRLLDDPDPEVYDTVATELANFGKDIIPKLESLWENTDNEEVQLRIELLIHRVHFDKQQKDLHDWSKEKNPSLIRGAIIVAQYAYPHFDVQDLSIQLEKMRKNVWLEMNNYLSPLEQVNIFNSILYNFYKVEGHELTERKPDHFFINKLIETKHGNSFSIGILYLFLCEMLDVPVFAIPLPKQFVFAYIDSLHHFYQPLEDAPVNHIQFFIDPITGMVYTKNDVDAYLKKLNLPSQPKYFAPMTATEIIAQLLRELRTCYKLNKEEEKVQEISDLLQILVPQD